MNDKSLPITIYEPDHILKTGIRIWPEMFKELSEHRELTWSLMVRDISARYKQSALGILWAVLMPLVMLAIFMWVKGKNILPIGDTLMPYAAFVFFGQMIWLLFSQGLINTAHSLVAAGSMLTKINFPREVLVFSAIGQTIFEFVIRIPLLVIIFIWSGFLPGPMVILTPIILLPLVILIVGLGFVLALFNALFRDVSSVLGISIQLGILVTPVFYPPPATMPYAFLINFINPVSGILNAARDLTTIGQMTDPLAYLFATISSLLIFFSGWRLFHLVEPRIAERI